jgi:hypothetical protein
MANSGDTANRTDIFAALSGENGEENGQVQVNRNPQSVRQRIKDHREVHGDR